VNERLISVPITYRKLQNTVIELKYHIVVRVRMKDYNLIINASGKKTLCYVMCGRIITCNPKAGKTGYMIILTYSLCNLRVRVPMSLQCGCM
jgi:hypothetical protein